MEKFSINLKRERTSFGLTQKQFAEKLEIPTERYRKYECLGKGRRTPDLEMVVKMAAILKTTTDALLGAGQN